jgi:WhiB family redox-sensing transcriptional regulator
MLIHADAVGSVAATNHYGWKRTGAMVSANPIVWRELGACRGLEPGMFYPDEEEDAQAAKSVCEQCDVRIACLEHALASREKQGVWGGATERERRRMIRQRRRTA